MTMIAPHITAFLRERLPLEMRASVHTCDSYAYAFQLLLNFASDRLKIPPCSLALEQIDAPMVLSFLEDLEKNRGNSGSTRNARLAAVRSFMRFLEHRVPAALEQIRRVLSIPLKKTDGRLVGYLTVDEMEAILDAPNPSTWEGIRDQAMLYLGFTAGLRVSELVGLRTADLSLQPTPTILVFGKGRKERALPLWKEAGVALRAWLEARGDAKVPELFLNARGFQLTRAGFEYILEKHVTLAVPRCPSLLNKTISPHVLRHTCAMNILRATGDLSKVALWLGHSGLQTAGVYVAANDTEKLDVLAAVTVPKLRRGVFSPPDKLIAMLKAPILCEANRGPTRPRQHPPGRNST